MKKNVRLLHYLLSALLYTVLIMFLLQNRYNINYNWQANANWTTRRKGWFKEFT